MVVFVLVLRLVITRIVQRWLETELLPRAGRAEPPSSPWSRSSAILARLLTGIGFDLQKIALIAGALAVGIGFGLQSCRISCPA